MSGPGMGPAGGMGRGLVRRMGREDEIGDFRMNRKVWRRVLGYARPYRGLIVLFVLLVIASAAFSVAPPLLFGRIIDDGVLAGNSRVVVILALVVAGLAIATALISLVERWCSSRIGEGLIYDLRTEVFDHVLSMPVAFFTRTQTGKLVSRVNNDVIGAQQAFTSTLSNVVSNVIRLILVLAAMIALSWQLTVASLVLLPVFFIPARFMGRRLANLTRRQMQYNADMSASMTERFSVSGALLVKLFGRSREEHDTFAAKAGGVRTVSVEIAMNQRLFMVLLTLLAALATALVYGAGGVMAIEGLLTVGTVTALAGLLTQLYGPLTQLTNVRIDVMSAMVSFDRVFEVLDLAPMIADRPDARRSTEPASVEFGDVRFTYPSAADVSLGSLETIAVSERANTEVLKGISFRVEHGQTMALVGASGGGKTTITHLIARLYDVTGGTVSVAGLDVRDWELTGLTELVGYVTQDAHMFHDTIRANLLYARRDAVEEDLWRVLAAAQVAELVRSLPDGLDTIVGERGYRLSGGERQRLAIARLLLKSPPIVILDEATAHLDSESEAAVQRALDEAMRDRTSIVIAHRLSTIRDADQILVVNDGRIVEQGTHDDLVAAEGPYHELYTRQFADPH